MVLLIKKFIRTVQVTAYLGFFSTQIVYEVR